MRFTATKKEAKFAIGEKMKSMNKKIILIGLVTIICGLGFNVSLGELN